MQTHKSKKASIGRKGIAAISIPYTRRVCEKLNLESNKKNFTRIRHVRAGRINDTAIKLAIMEILADEKARERKIKKLENSD